MHVFLFFQGVDLEGLEISSWPGTVIQMDHICFPPYALLCLMAFNCPTSHSGRARHTLLQDIFENILMCCKDLCPCAKQPLNIPVSEAPAEGTVAIPNMQQCGTLQGDTTHICVQCTAVSAVGKLLNLFSANNYCSNDWLLNRVLS